jgi:hypothetical protein
LPAAFALQSGNSGGLLKPDNLNARNDPVKPIDDEANFSCMDSETGRRLAETLDILIPHG